MQAKSKAPGSELNRGRELLIKELVLLNSVTYLASNVDKTTLQDRSEFHERYVFNVLLVLSICYDLFYIHNSPLGGTVKSSIKENIFKKLEPEILKHGEDKNRNSLF